MVSITLEVIYIPTPPAESPRKKDSNLWPLVNRVKTRLAKIKKTMGNNK